MSYHHSVSVWLPDETHNRGNSADSNGTFSELTDTLPVMPEDLFDDAKTLEERTALAEDWAAQLQDYLSPVMTDKAIEAFVAKPNAGRV